MNRAALALVAVTVIGLIITLVLLANAGFGAVFGIIGRIGALGFLGYVGFTFLILALLGSAHAVVAGQADKLPTFVWARITREAATDVLPFSQLGGVVIAARSLVARGLSQALTYASLVADQTSELAAQLVYTLYGVAVLLVMLDRDPSAGDLRNLAMVGLGASVAIILLFTAAQKPMLLLAARIAGAILPDSAAAVGDVQTTLAGLYRRRGALVASFLLHLAAWVAAGAGAWIALRLIGVTLPVGDVIVIESLIFTLRTAAFLVPGAIGLQEGAYVLLAPLFGLPVEAALALSLVKRARDLAIGVPVMIAWQIGEGRGLLSRS